jgi:diguanylate cyclase (GGDEF)-like protein
VTVVGMRQHRRRLAAVAMLVVVAGGLVSAGLAHRFHASVDQARDELFAGSVDQAAASVGASAVNLQILAQAIAGLFEDADPSEEDLRRLIGRSTTGAGRGNAMPGIELAVIVVDDPELGLRLGSPHTIGLARDIGGHQILEDGSIDQGLQRSAATGLATWVSVAELGGDIALVEPLAATEGGTARWAMVLVDREALLSRLLRGSRLAVDASTTSDEPVVEPIRIVDLDTGDVPVADARSRTELITVADRTWQLDFLAQPSFDEQLPEAPVGTMLIGGMLITLLAAWHVWTQGTRRARAVEEAQRITAALEEQQLQFRSLAAASPVGIAYTDLDGTVRYANLRLCTILLPDPAIVSGEVAPGEGPHLEGAPLWRWLCEPDARHLEEILAEVEGPPEHELRATLPDGRTVQLRLAVVGDDEHDRRGWAVSVEDITPEVRRQEVLRTEEARHRELAERFAHRAAHDPLTELPNRSRLLERLRELLVTGTEAAAGVVFVDLDGFKVVNDGLGHAAGDRLLKLVAMRLQEAVRPGDLIARLGGDEFAVVVDGPVDPRDLERLARRLLERIEQPFALDERRISVSASLGLALSRDRQDAADLLRDADLAMYAAKRDRGSGWRWYRPAMHERVRERHELENELRAALGAGALTCAYQPIVDLHLGTDRMVEALARWEHVDLGPVSPQIFAAIAEETGMIGMLGRQILAAATAEAVGWGPEGPDVAVNCTVTELVTPGYLEQLQETLFRTGLVATRLVLELTESDLATDDQALPAVLGDLRAAGVRIAIDDFGTGRSSLAKLRELPIDILKIDRRFVEGIDRSRRDRAFIEAIVNLSNTLGLVTVAEGIETADQLTVLREIGCRLGQGYHLARPMPPAALRDRAAASVINGSPALGS